MKRVHTLRLSDAESVKLFAAFQQETKHKYRGRFFSRWMREVLLKHAEDLDEVLRITSARSSAK